MTSGPPDQVATIRQLLSQTHGSPRPEEIEVQGDLAYAISTVDGVLTPRAGGDPQQIRFRVLWLLQREAGEWKVFRQIWNDKPVG